VVGAKEGCIIVRRIILCLITVLMFPQTDFPQGHDTGIPSGIIVFIASGVCPPGFTTVNTVNALLLDGKTPTKLTGCKAN
jgi:hypothetical protein